jgi:hypothetical protein
MVCARVHRSFSLPLGRLVACCFSLETNRVVRSRRRFDWAASAHAQFGPTLDSSGEMCGWTEHYNETPCFVNSNWNLGSTCSGVANSIPDDAECEVKANWYREVPSLRRTEGSRYSRPRRV